MKSMSSIFVEDWGLVDYLEGYERQKKCVQSVIEGAVDHLILCEHPAVLTIGENDQSRKPALSAS